MSGRRQFEPEDIVVPVTPAPPEFAARHYSVQEVAEMWGMGVDYIRALFAREPDIAVFEPINRSKYSKRGYRTFRIPAHVVARVYARLQSKSA